MLPPPPTSTRTAPPFPSTTLFRSVVIGDCPHAHEIAPLLATVGAAIVAQGVSRIGDALKAAGNAETQTALARRTVEFDTSGTLPKCVAIARGWVYRSVPDHPKADDQGIVIDRKSVA